MKEYKEVLGDHERKQEARLTRWKAPAVSWMLCSGLLQSLIPVLWSNTPLAPLPVTFTCLTDRVLWQWLCLSSHTRLRKAGSICFTLFGKLASCCAESVWEELRPAKVT